MDVCRFDIDYSDRKEFLFGLFSDLHLDSPGHDRKRFEADIESIIARGGRVFINGDIVDGIFPTDRKRYSRSGDAKHGDAQVNELAELVVRRLEPYADYIDYLGMGNHEATIVKYNNTDILHLIAYMLQAKRSKALPSIKRSGYVGFINLAFHIDGARLRRYVIWRDHGKGGVAPVTRGMINFNRMYTTYNADLYWIGHSHNSLIDRSGWSIGVSPRGEIYRKQKIGVVTAGYHKNFESRTFEDGEYYRNNFAEEKFFAPTALGCAKLNIRLVDKMESWVE